MRTLGAVLCGCGPALPVGLSDQDLLATSFEMPARGLLSARSVDEIDDWTGGSNPRPDCHPVGDQQCEQKYSRDYEVRNSQRGQAQIVRQRPLGIPLWI